jgi:hypothetical protein
MPERKTPPKPPGTAGKEQKSHRLAAALRANLARRRAQKRARDATATRDAGSGKEQG